jgi:hypothetical protein
VVDVHDIKSVDRERTESSTPRRTRGCDLRPGAEPMTMTTPRPRRNFPTGATAGRDRVRTAPVPSSNWRLEAVIVAHPARSYDCLQPFSRG